MVSGFVEWMIKQIHIQPALFMIDSLPPLLPVESRDW